MIRFDKDGKVERDSLWVNYHAADLADAVDVLAAALRDIEKNYYNTVAGRWKATTALRQIGADK